MSDHPADDWASAIYGSRNQRLRVFVEGVVTVDSILLAFGIHTWWEGTQDARKNGVS